MSEYEMIETLDNVRNLCDQIAICSSTAKKQGRMESLDEARRMDALSQELMQHIQSLSAVVRPDGAPLEQQGRIDEMLEQARKTLEQLVQPAKPATLNRGGGGMPRAASNRLQAYYTC